VSLKGSDDVCYSPRSTNDGLRNVGDDEFSIVVVVWWGVGARIVRGSDVSDSNLSGGDL
jgi:oxalate decarboxylase/phosphoglucose isomerase-like protein (cupin superfamily)